MTRLLPPPTPRPRARTGAVLALLLVAVLAGCGSSDSSSSSATTAASTTAGAGAGGSATVGDLSVEQATIDYPANPKVAAVRMVIRNDGDADALVAVSSPVAAHAMVHRTTTDDQGRSNMEMVSSLPIAAHATVTFEPGGLHVMLTDVSKDLQVGDQVPVTLTFEKAGDVTVQAEVVEPGTQGQDGSHDH